MNTSIQSLAIVTLAVVGFGLSPKMHAVIPPPDGGYPNFNTAEGTNALQNLTTGVGNAAVGWYSLFSNTDGSFNTAVGAGSLLFNVGNQNLHQGVENTAVGTAALLFNTVGFSNTAIGAATLVNNTTGGLNTANGFSALQNNTTGGANTVIGVFALLNNTTGSYNTANGVYALESNTTGNFNTAIGSSALQNNTMGNDNTAVGFGALVNSTGSASIAIGSNAGELVGSSNNVIAIGSPGDDVDNSTWIGNIYGVTTQSGTTAPVIVSEDGQLGTVASSERFKKDIASIDRTSEAILSLRPVTFRYKSDTKDTPQFGLIAEEVAKVNPALVLSDKEGKPYTVRYDAVNAMLLNEFLREHRKVQQQESTIANLKSAMAEQRKDFEAAIAQQQKTTETLAARLNEQETRIQEVSAQLAVHAEDAQQLVGNQ